MAGTRSIFILGQAAVTVTLLAMAALLALSYRLMMSTNTGFTNRDTVSMNLQLRGTGAATGQGPDMKSRRLFYTNLLNRLREAPGVTSAAAVLVRPLEGTIGWDVSYEFEFEAARKNTQALPKANYEVVTPDYFKTVGTPLLQGRDFNDHDSEDREPVAIISHTLAERIRASGHTPLGYRVRLGLGGWKKVVGVCSDARYRSVTQRGVDIFVPYLQAQQPTNYVVIRGSPGSRDLTALVRQTLAKVDPSQAVAGVATIGELIDANTARHRFNMILLLWFGICAVILAATGVYSVIAETMTEREVEMAIKTALGARRPRLVGDVVSGILGCVLIGEALGVFCAAAIGSLVSDLLYGVSPRDPIILGSLCTFLFVVSLLAAFWPAWTAAGGGMRASLRTS